MMKTLISAAVVASTAMVQTAIASEIQTRNLSFDHKGTTMAGTLYLPADYESGDKLPVVIVTGAWTSVQQQMPAVYAREMVARGYAAFTFDFRGWGQSGDQENQVRYKEDPAAKTADIKAAISYMATRPEIDVAQIHGLGICASAGYMIDAVSGNTKIRSVALVAPWLQNKEIVEAVYGGADGVAGLMAVAANAAAAPSDVIIPAAGPEGAEGVLMPIGGYYYEPSRGAIPEYDNKWNQESWADWLTYYPADHAATLDKPLAIVHSESAAIPQGVKTFLADYVGAATLRMLEDVSQFDFYDNPADVQRAADTVTAHFAANGNG